MKQPMALCDGPVGIDAGPHSPAAIPADDQDRADLWALVGALLLRPTVPLLHLLAQAPALPVGDHAALASAWQALVDAARTGGPQAVQQEHAALFVAVGPPLVDPHASLYMSGFLMDGTLARLRADLRALGQARQHHAAHTEDHLGALCESMRLLIGGAAGLPRQPWPVQQRFLATHLLPWAGDCLHDMQQAAGTSFYAVLADFFQAFLASECLLLELDVNLSPEAHHAVAVHA